MRGGSRSGGCPLGGHSRRGCRWRWSPWACAWLARDEPALLLREHGRCFSYVADECEAPLHVDARDLGELPLDRRRVRAGRGDQLPELFLGRRDLLLGAGELLFCPRLDRLELCSLL